MNNETMAPTRDAILKHLQSLLRELTTDWDRDEEIGAATGLFSELGFQSLDIVVLATSLQEHYQREMPFAELFADIGQREVRDVSVGELADFVDAQLNGNGPLGP